MKRKDVMNATKVLQMPMAARYHTLSMLQRWIVRDATRKMARWSCQNAQDVMMSINCMLSPRSEN